MMAVIARYSLLTSMAKAEVNVSAVLEALKNVQQNTLPEAQRKAMENVCLKVEADSKKNCPPSVTGTLRASITHTVAEEEGRIVGYVGSDLDYAPYVHQGTGIYAIEGNGRKNVPWTYYDERKGEWVSTEGIKPTPFIQQAIDENREQITEYFRGVLGND